MPTKTTNQMMTKQGMIDRLSENEKADKPKATKKATKKVTAATVAKAVEAKPAKRGRPPVVTAALLKAIKSQRGKATAISLETSPAMMIKMHQAGLVTITGKVQTKKRGRPAYLYGITDAGRKVVGRS